MELPIGSIYTSNITPDRDHGIGRFTLADFDRAMRYGVAKGHTLYPAMPFVSYAVARPEDIAALFAYFRSGVAAAPVDPPRNRIIFPLSMRFPLTLWRWAFAPEPKPFMLARDGDPRSSQGAYFVEGLGHCGECHTPRGLAMQLEARKPSEGDAYLSGAVVDHLFAPSLRNVGRGSLSSWGEDDLTRFLRSGANAHGIAFGSMVDVIEHSTQYMTPQDAVATARYLKSFDSTPAVVRHAYDTRTDLRLASGDAGAPGAMVYLNNCAACHRPDGKGYEGVFPSLAGNPVVEARDPASLAAIVLEGSITPRTGTTPARFSMPAFRERLSDQQIADVISFIRKGWGNAAGSMAPEDVGRLRKELASK